MTTLPPLRDGSILYRETPTGPVEVARLDSSGVTLAAISGLDVPIEVGIEANKDFNNWISFLEQRYRIPVIPTVRQTWSLSYNGQMLKFDFDYGHIQLSRFSYRPSTGILSSNTRPSVLLPWSDFLWWARRIALFFEFAGETHLP